MLAKAWGEVQRKLAAGKNALAGSGRRGCIHRMPDPRAIMPPDAEIIAGMLASLDAAGPAGLTGAKLLAGPAASRGERIVALQRLERGGLAVLRTKGKGQIWFAARHAPTVEVVMASLREKAVPHGAVAWTVGELSRLLPAAQRDLVAESLSALAAAGEASELRAAKGAGRYWLFSKALQVGHQRLPAPSGMQGTESAILAAYAAWRKPTGSSLMAIHELQTASGVALAELHNWLRREAAAGRAELSEGDWSLASDSAREAALSLQGQKFIRVRLHERG